MARSPAVPENTIWADQPIRMKGGLENRQNERSYRISSAWWRGDDCNFMPDKGALLAPEAVFDEVLRGWAPPRPVLNQSTRIAAFGSCFAANISNWLNARRYTVVTRDASARSYVVQFSDAMVTTFSILQQFQWALEDKAFSQNLWHGKDKRAQAYDDEIKAATRALFLNSDVFIVTLGLSEVWYDAVTGETFWRAIPRDEVDPERHKFRVSSVEENAGNIREIHRLVQKHRPGAKVIFTLSPIPLAATFRDVSCITANSVSKAVLRAAIDQTYREVNGDAPPETFFYWPSYEIVTELFADAWKADRRHIHEPVLDFIMTAFEAAWCQDSTPPKSLLQTWVEAKIADGTLPRRAQRLAERGAREELRDLIEKLKVSDMRRGALLEAWAAEGGRL